MNLKLYKVTYDPQIASPPVYKEEDMPFAEKVVRQDSSEVDWRATFDMLHQASPEYMLVPEFNPAFREGACEHPCGTSENPYDGVDYEKACWWLTGFRAEMRQLANEGNTFTPLGSC